MCSDIDTAVDSNYKNQVDFDSIGRSTVFLNSFVVKDSFEEVKGGQYRLRVEVDFDSSGSYFFLQVNDSLPFWKTKKHLGSDLTETSSGFEYITTVVQKFYIEHVHGTRRPSGTL